MDSVTATLPTDSEVQFDTARITGEIEALAEKHAGKDDQFRAAITQLLKENWRAHAKLLRHSS
jgi:[protein-PII] uridylyltransferase